MGLIIIIRHYCEIKLATAKSMWIYPLSLL